MPDLEETSIGAAAEHTSDLPTKAAGGFTGGLRVPTSTVHAYLIDYQTLTSHGNEAVSDATIITNVAHSPGVAILSATNWRTTERLSRKGRVHVPIHNPPNINGKWRLSNISVNSEGENGGSVDTVLVYYDQTLTMGVEPRATRAFNFPVDGDIYPPPKGIVVEVNVNFEGSESTVKLYSVTLLYQVQVS